MQEIFQLYFILTKGLKAPPEITLDDVFLDLPREPPKLYMFFGEKKKDKIEALMAERGVGRSAVERQKVQKERIFTV